MRNDFMTLQALLVACGIMLVWLLWRTKPWRLARKARREGPAVSPALAEQLMVRKADDSSL